MRVKSVAPACVVVALSAFACSQDTDQSDKYRNLLAFFQDNKIGVSGDYAVFKNGLGGNEPVVAVFGFVDNSQTCEDIATEFNKTEPNAYHCEALQH